MDTSIASEGKKCSRCKQIKALSEFKKSSSSSDGHNSACKECTRGYDKNWCRECNQRMQKAKMILVRPRYYLCQPCWEKLRGKKKCLGCRKILDLQEFAEDKSRPDGHEYYCRSCRKEHQVKKHIKVLIQRGEKQCISCRQFKAIEEFFENHTTKDKIDLYCKQCRMEAKTRTPPEKDIHREYREFHISKDRERRVRSRYGITIDDYRELYEQQKGLCAICGRPEMLTRNTLLGVDHNHETGKVRALLCNSCNTGLGAFEEKPEYLLKAIEYLQQHSTP